MAQTIETPIIETIRESLISAKRKELEEFVPDCFFDKRFLEECRRIDDVRMPGIIESLKKRNGYIKKFQTESKDVYFKNLSKGLWFRGSHPDIDVVYVGSINPSESEVIMSGRYVNQHLLALQLYNKRIPGFTPQFVLGYSPLGLITDPENIKELDEGKIVLRDLSKTNGRHVGNKIIEVYSKD